MKDKELFQIALKYVNKNYSYENLKDGDDLYNSNVEEKEKCLSFYSEIMEQGTDWAEKRLSEFGKIKITFGLQKKDIERIESEIKRFDDCLDGTEDNLKKGWIKYDEIFWNRMGKELGFSPMYLALSYLRSIE